MAERVKALQILNHVRKKLKSTCTLDYGDSRDTVFLAGTGRSGTTWIQDVINGRNDFRILFEPFHSKKVQLLKEWNYRQYLPPEEEAEKFVRPATAILNGNVNEAWIDQFNKKYFSKKRIVKDIRTHFLLKWIDVHFPEIPIILLLRHPCAVANSKLKLEWGTHLDDILRQDRLLADFLEPFEDEIRGAESSFEKHVFMWCIENYVPLKQFSSKEIKIVFYEKMCCNYEKEVRSLYQFIGKRFSDQVLAKQSEPSVMSREKSAIRTGRDPVNAWRQNIGEDQIRRAVEICEIFGMHQIYGEDSLPRVRGDEALCLLSDHP